MFSLLPQYLEKQPLHYVAITVTDCNVETLGMDPPAAVLYGISTVFAFPRL